MTYSKFLNAYVNDLQTDIKGKVITLVVQSIEQDYTSEEVVSNVQCAMDSRVYELCDTIDLQEVYNYIEELEQ